MAAVYCNNNSKLRKPVLVLTWMYTAFRFLFVILYVNKVQPWRSVCWLLSTLTILALGIIAILGAGEFVTP